MPRSSDPLSLPDPGATRREFVRSTVAAAVALGLWPVPSVAGEAPSTGKARRPPSGLSVLTADEAAVYAAWCDHLAPGAAEAAAADTTRVWKTPPPSLFFFVSRADAVDVAWGTEAGFQRLGVPYIAHIRPPSAW